MGLAQAKKVSENLRGTLKLLCSGSLGNIKCQQK